jgi:hypothetical protein
MTGIQGVSSNQSILFLELSSITSSTGSNNSIGSTPGGGLGASSSASISGPGQLFSNLQQLQSQNSTEFTQIVNQIASQIQSASQSVQGPLSQYLQSLSNSFQNVANTGDLNQLQQTPPLGPPPTYNANGQGVQSNSSGIAQVGHMMHQLFATISQEVSQALASTSTSSTTSVGSAGKA